MLFTYSFAVHLCIVLQIFIRCVVWTGDGRVFFYNPSARTSVWERPEELVGRFDVTKMISTPPAVVVALKKESQDSTDGTVPAKKAKLDSGSQESGNNHAKILDLISYDYSKYIFILCSL